MILKNIYTFGIMSHRFFCGGGGAPPPPPPPPPPPQLAKSADVSAVRGNVAKNVQSDTGGGTILTGGQGDTSSIADKLGKKTLLGQ